MFWALVAACLSAGPGQSARFRVLPDLGPAQLQWLRQRMGVNGYDELLRLNRVDDAHAARLDSLVVPDSLADFVAPSPFPERLARLDTLACAVLVGVRLQAFAVYDSGRQVRWGPVSTGRRGDETQPGAYSVNWKGTVHRSTADPSWLMPWTVNIDNFGGTALHEYALPGRPASHCCIRLREPDARWLYDHVRAWTVAADGRQVIRPGTPVFVLGRYDFAARRPWRDLDGRPGRARYGLAELDSALASLSPR